MSRVVRRACLAERPATKSALAAEGVAPCVRGDLIPHDSKKVSR